MSRFQSVSLPTLSDTSGMREVENEARKMGLDVLQKLNTVDAELTADIETVQENVDTVQANLDALDSAISTAFDTVVSGSLSNASAVALTTGTTANITSITLTAGSWDISGSGAWVQTATTSINFIFFALSLTSATLPLVASNTGEIPTSSGEFRFRPPFVNPTVFTSSSPFSFPFGQFRLEVSATTTYYFVVNSAFTVSTLSAYGWIQARKVY